MNDPTLDGNPLITQFKSAHDDQWELNDENIKRVDPQSGETILHNYCQFINTTPLSVFKCLVEIYGIDINAQNKAGVTPIYLALQKFDPNHDNNITILTYLLNQNDVDANIKNGLGCTLLHAACLHSDTLPVDIFKLLIETHGADVNVQDNYKNTPLHNAFQPFNPDDDGNFGDITALTYLLSQDGIDANITDQHGHTLLHAACLYIDTLPIDIFKHLIEIKGANINLRDDDENTPLHYAFSYFEPTIGDGIAVLAYLLSQDDIDFNARGQAGTLLVLIYEYTNVLPLDIFKSFVEKKSNGGINVPKNNADIPIHYASRGCINEPSNGNNAAVLTYLLSQDSLEINTEDDLSGCTLLHTACFNINELPLAVFKCLIEVKDANVNKRDGYGNTPIHYALEKFDPNNGGDVTTLTYLLSQDHVNPYITGQSNRNLLHWVCFRDCSSEGEADAFWSRIAEKIVQIYMKHVFNGAPPG
jgi:ankyrin repeat protein